MNDLFSNHGSPYPAQVGQGPSASMQVARMVLSMDHRAWLEWLADEWWPMCETDGTVLWLGVERAVDIPHVEGRINIAAWIDPKRLPNLNVQCCRAGKWSEKAIHLVDLMDEQVLWAGPIPIDAVDSFMVESPSDVNRIVAMAKGFANIELPAQPINVGVVNSIPKESFSGRISERLLPPFAWGAQRGAAAMALWAVPPIDPWLDTLSASLAIAPQEAMKVDQRTPWLRAPVWRKATEVAAVPPFWFAMVEVLGAANVKEWRQVELLDRIKVRAIELGAEKNQLDHLADQTRAILEDRKVVSVDLEHSDPLGLVLQLVLLRHTPDRFARWREDLPGLSPAVWWTGAMLVGYVTGYRNLAPLYRGTREARKALAVRTWQVGNESNALGATQISTSQENIRWTDSGDRIDIWLGQTLLAEKPGSTRGRWFRANYDDRNVRIQAIDVAGRFCPNALKQTLQLTSGTLSYSGSGNVTLDSTNNALLINGAINLSLDANARLVGDLDVMAFKEWLANGSITERLPRPPQSVILPPVQDKAKPKRQIGKRSILESAPPGLTMIEDFISLDEESYFLQRVDTLPWLDDLSRRVQHYGWKYDYKTKKIKKENYLGSLPNWAQMLARRLLDSGVIGEMPDQVIVNEYVKNQGIAKHIDCPICFVGPIVTISLNESWGMVFRGPEEQKIELTLPRRSAVILDGEVRSKWMHEIPKRQKEGGKLRLRRVSLTFRKINY